MLFRCELYMRVLFTKLPIVKIPVGAGCKLSAGHFSRIADKSFRPKARWDRL